MLIAADQNVCCWQINNLQLKTTFCVSPIWFVFKLFAHNDFYVEIIHEINWLEMRLTTDAWFLLTSSESDDVVHK